MSLLDRDDGHPSLLIKGLRYIQYNLEEALILFANGIVYAYDFLAQFPYKKTLSIAAGAAILFALLGGV